MQKKWFVEICSSEGLKIQLIVGLVDCGLVQEIVIGPLRCNINSVSDAETLWGALSANVFGHKALVESKEHTDGGRDQVALGKQAEEIAAPELEAAQNALAPQAERLGEQRVDSLWRREVARGKESCRVAEGERDEVAGFGESEAAALPHKPVEARGVHERPDHDSLLASQRKPRDHPGGREPRGSDREDLDPLLCFPPRGRVDYPQ